MNELTVVSLIPLLPELVLALGGLVLLVAGVFLGNGGTRVISWGVIATFAVASLFLLGLDWGRHSAFGGMFVMDEFAGTMKLFVLVGLMLAITISIRYLYEEELARFEYPILVLFAGLGMLVMISAGNLLSVYMGLELQSLCLYVLAAFRRTQTRSAEAGVKYFILGALASGMMLFGMSLIYGYVGALGFDAIGRTLEIDGAAPGLVVGMVFLLAGIAFKISAAPFHMWTPDVYEGAPTSVTALFAIAPKVAAMALLMRLLFGPFESVMADWQQIIWVLAMASIVVGAFGAILQKNIKRLMAYSSIGNMGYAMIGIAAGTQEGVGAVIVYLVIYMIMTAGVFSIIMIMRRGGVAVDEIEDLSGLSRTSPLTAYAMAILMFSMSGIPPMAGFFGKMLVFKAAVASGFYVLAVAGILTSVVAAYYYLRVIKVMFFDEPIDTFDRQVAFSRRAVILMSVIFVLFFILSPDMLVETGYNAAAALFAGS